MLTYFRCADGKIEHLEFEKQLYLGALALPTGLVLWMRRRGWI